MENLRLNALLLLPLILSLLSCTFRTWSDTNILIIGDPGSYGWGNLRWQCLSLTSGFQFISVLETRDQFWLNWYILSLFQYPWLSKPPTQSRRTWWLEVFQIAQITDRRVKRHQPNIFPIAHPRQRNKKAMEIVLGFKRGGSRIILSRVFPWILWTVMPNPSATAWGLQLIEMFFFTVAVGYLTLHFVLLLLQGMGMTTSLSTRVTSLKSSILAFGKRMKT